MTTLECKLRVLVLCAGTSASGSIVGAMNFHVLVVGDWLDEAEDVFAARSALKR
jgi:hypothetical protein